MSDLSDLSRILHRIDGRGYRAYRDIAGSYRAGAGQISIDYVQGDPFAAPSKVRFRVDQNRAQIPEELIKPKVRRIALEDFLARRVDETIRQASPERRGTGSSGLLSIDAGRQEVLERTAAVANPSWVEVRLEVGLPAAGRRVLGRQAEDMLCRVLPELVENGLTWSPSIDSRGRDFVLCVENQEAIRDQLEERGLVAFVGEASILPRQSGVSDRPLKDDGVVSFESPETLRVTLDLPNPSQPFGEGKRTISGMGIPRGVTLIIGGGYHGKSTLLRALERGVYPHIHGDGREFVVTHPDATKIRAEDRRRVEKIDLSPFIGELPNGQSTEAFSTEEASGSTSQAAAIMEAIEAGARVLLMDEDTSATNLMVRDARMQALVEKLHEPITPLVDRIREIYEKAGVSTILVMGGSGDYFEAADTVITMREYHALDGTDEAKRVAQSTHRRSQSTLCIRHRPHSTCSFPQPFARPPPGKDRRSGRRRNPIWREHDRPPLCRTVSRPQPNPRRRALSPPGLPAFHGWKIDCEGCPLLSRGIFQSGRTRCPPGGSHRPLSPGLTSSRKLRPPKTP